MNKLTKRKGFNFFRSYFDVYNELETNEDKVMFIDALLDRQFMGIKPTNLKGMAKFAYISQTNSIDSQVKGYEDKTGIKFTPTVGGKQGVTEPPTEQVQVEEKEKVKDKEIITIESRKLKFAHTLKPFLDLYGKDMIRSFYEYWTEHGEKDLKFRMEKEKSFGIERRLKTWSTNNYNKKPQTNEELNNLTTEIRKNNPRI